MRASPPKPGQAAFLFIFVTHFGFGTVGIISHCSWDIQSCLKTRVYGRDTTAVLNSGRTKSSRLYGKPWYSSPFPTFFLSYTPQRFPRVPFQKEMPTKSNRLQTRRFFLTRDTSDVSYVPYIRHCPSWLILLQRTMA